MDIDFGYGASNNGNSTGSENESNKETNVTDIDTGKVSTTVSNESPENVDSVSDINDSNDNTKEKNTVKENNTDNDKESLAVGTSIEVEGQTYTVDDKGNVVDANGNIFKESSAVKDWLDGLEKIEEDNEFSINSIQEAIGINIVDDDDKPIEFDNTPEGIAAYVNAVIDTAREEYYETAINTLYQKYPIINDVLNYYIANGNSLEGFGEVPDRSGITVDDSNEAQQEAIIRTAWSERGQKGDVESYIAYLKSSGTLTVTAKEELENLQAADEEYRNRMEEEAERIENERIETLNNYWNGVHDIIKKRNIAGYEIPESIIINRNGQKFSVTPEDFFNYLYRVDHEGKSAYERDLEKDTPESRRDDEILRAYLKFVGGNYSNLVDMAINKEKVNKLKFKAKQKTTSTARIIKPKTTTTNNKNIDLGYN